MNLSLFENDGTLGELAAARGVMIRVSGSLNIGGNLGWSTAAKNIQDALSGRGWEVTGVTQETTLWYPGQTQTFLVFANVLNEFDDNAIAYSIRRDLGGLMTNIGVTIVGSGAQHAPGKGADDPNKKKDDYTLYYVAGGAALLLMLLMRR